MKIKIPPRAEVTDEFLNACSALAAIRLKRILDELPYTPRQKLAEMRFVVNQLKPIAKKSIEPGIGLDLMKTKLRSIRGLLRFDASGPWPYTSALYAYTDDVIMTEVHNKNMKYYMGKYRIVVPTDVFLEMEPDLISFVSIGNEDLRATHPHHRTGHTCWSGYAGQINNSIRCLDIPNMFGLLRKFLGEFYISSQLTRDWDRIAVRYEDYLQS